MAWGSSNRKSRLPADWGKRRKSVFDRKGRQCSLQFPGTCTGHATEIDHIRPGDDHGIDNLQPVCSACHSLKSAAEGHSAQRAKRNLGRRPPEPHPGDVKRG